ncbi:SRPBCC family protein [Cellulomonas edaphi]|uniref:SRPBCC family protein n=1 Tax=Cellulomonas edaphi TaxID=3053468 RepID=A0ABT7S4N6_9CELL|nr:SRPBCC family protein [Cellulomons edaphi]MDM7830592.1 SRPBCC family protein [Cellulomons edaphi]
MIRATRTLPVPADEAWELLTDARNHARWIPLTRVQTDGPPRVGTRIVATSGPGARRGWPGLVDRMQITRADPPGPDRVAVFVKRGPVLLGEARIEVSALDDSHARIVWAEDVYLAHVPSALGRALVRPFLGAMLRRALTAAAAESSATDRRC